MSNKILDSEHIKTDYKFKLSKTEVLIWSFVALISLIFKLLYWPGSFIFFAIFTSGFGGYSLFGLVASKGKSIVCIVLSIVAMSWMIWTSFTSYYSLIGLITAWGILINVFAIHLIAHKVKLSKKETVLLNNDKNQPPFGIRNSKTNKLSPGEPNPIRRKIVRWLNNVFPPKS